MSAISMYHIEGYRSGSTSRTDYRTPRRFINDRVRWYSEISDAMDLPDRRGDGTAQVDGEAP
jgi:hypothetical protein